MHRARPGELLYSGWSAFSFPSGHSTVNVVLYGFLAFLIAREFRPALRVSVALGAATLIFLIAFSRLYLGAHWLSDVLGGLAFGSAWLALLGLSYLGRQVERIEIMPVVFDLGSFRNGKSESPKDLDNAVSYDADRMSGSNR